jgi:hypothetical protein
MATQQPAGAKGFAADIPPDTMFGPPVGNGSDDSLGTRAVPTRAQSAVVGDGDLRPTPENYLQQNPTVPQYLKNDGRRAKRWERNALCRYIGTLGIYYGHKHRSWFMAISGIITMTCLMLSIPPLVATTSTPQLLYAFNWARVETHWQLIQPVDWTENVYMGLLGMANKTHRTQSYYVPYNTKYCREFIGPICNSCYTASILTIIFLSISIIAGVLGLILDVHRIFSYFDYNLSKSLALFLHLVIGFPCSLVAWILWIVMCWAPIPGTVVFQGYGKTGVGIWLAKSWGSGAWCALFMFILRLIPGILHLLVPTPSWANNKGIKAMRNRKAEENNVLDPFDDISNAMMRKPLEERVDKDPAFAIPIRTHQPANPVGPLPPTERVRRDSDAVSVASEAGNYGEMVSRVADDVGATVPVMPLTNPDSNASGPTMPQARATAEDDEEESDEQLNPANMATTKMM